MKKIAVVGIPDKWSTETLADAIEAKTGFRLIVDMAKVTRDLKNNTLRYLNHDLSDLDAIVVKKISTQYSSNTEDRLELLRLAQSDGIKVFSNPETMLRLVNRLSCTVSLRNGNIPMPDTVITEDIEVAVKTVQRYGQAVFKPLFSTKARGMCLISADQPSKKILREVEEFKAENPMMYIQRRLDLPGQDIGLVFLGGKYQGAYARIANSSGTWNTTINSGGRYAPYKPSDEVIAIAQKAQDLFHLDFTTVDIAETADGPVVFEVSAFGGFRGAKEGAGIDAANLYADYVLGKLD